MSGHTVSSVVRLLPNLSVSLVTVALDAIGACNVAGTMKYTPSAVILTVFEVFLIGLCCEI